MATYNLSIMLGISGKSKTVLNRAFRFSETMRIVGSKAIDTSRKSKTVVKHGIGFGKNPWKPRFLDTKRFKTS